jgi:hypothetical protein
VDRGFWILQIVSLLGANWKVIEKAAGCEVSTGCPVVVNGEPF